MYSAFINKVIRFDTGGQILSTEVKFLSTVIKLKVTDLWVHDSCVGQEVQDDAPTFSFLFPNSYRIRSIERIRASSFLTPEMAR